MRKKKIGLFLNSKPYSGGTFQYNQAMIEAISSLPKERYDVVVTYINAIWLDYLSSYSLNIVEIPRGFWGRFIGKLWLKSGLPLSWRREFSHYFHLVSKTLCSQGCDLWVFPSQDIWSYQTKVPALAAIHDLMHRYERRFPEVSANGEYERREKHYSNMCKWVRGILVDSEVGQQQVHESYGIPFERIFVLPFVPPPHIYKNKVLNNFEQKYHLPAKFIFYPAQFWEHKNHVRLINAIAILMEEFLDVHLVLVGSKKNGYEKARREVEKLNIQNNVHFIGYVPDEDMLEFYRRARAMVMPTFFGPTNIPQFEAFVLGCPVATSNIYGIDKQVGDAALLFNPESTEEIAHCIRLLWTNDELCKKLSVKGKYRASSWGQINFNQRVLEIIKQMV